MRTLAKAIVGLILVQCAWAGGERYPFVEIEYAKVSQESAKIFDEQPMKEIVGDKSSEKILRIGLTSADYMSNHYKHKAYLFAWKGDVNDEVGFGFGGEYGVSLPWSEHLAFVLGGEIGYGWQPVKGDKITLSTNANKIGYIIGLPVKKGRFEGEMLQDTTIIRSDLTLGIVFAPMEHFSVDVKYRLMYGVYDFSYINYGMKKSLNAMTTDIFSHAFVFGVSYHF